MIIIVVNVLINNFFFIYAKIMLLYGIVSQILLILNVYNIMLHKMCVKGFNGTIKFINFVKKY